MPRNPDRYPTHPGALLREDVIPATGVAKAEIARLLWISRQHLHDILAERKPVSPDVAVRLTPIFRASPSPPSSYSAPTHITHSNHASHVSIPLPPASARLRQRVR